MLACSLRAAVAARATPLQRAPFTAKRLAASRRRTMAAAATAAASTAVKQVGLRSLLLLPLLLALTHAAAPAPPSCLAGAAAQSCAASRSAKQVCPRPVACLAAAAVRLLLAWIHPADCTQRRCNCVSDHFLCDVNCHRTMMRCARS